MKHTTRDIAIEQDTFRDDVVSGLSATQKHLDAKYFYDKRGDELFQQIMKCPEYYLTNCELEILMQQSNLIIEACKKFHNKIDIIELGAGDATKSIHLLKAAVSKNLTTTYIPIDISGNIIEHLRNFIPENIPDLIVDGQQGEYFEMLDKVSKQSDTPKLLLFLGASIGNMPVTDALNFCKALHQYLNPNDLLLIGFDLKKNPQTVLSAYNDEAGITKAFNLNLLDRINRELGANFITSNFIHYPVYDPGTGACKSYLISKIAHEVELGDGTTFHFTKDEPIYMEVSQKYTSTEIEDLAQLSGFSYINSFYDSKNMFCNTLWQVPY